MKAWYRSRLLWAAVLALLLSVLWAVLTWTGHEVPTWLAQALVALWALVVGALRLDTSAAVGSDPDPDSAEKES